MHRVVLSDVNPYWDSPKQHLIDTSISYVLSNNSPSSMGVSIPNHRWVKVNSADWDATGDAIATRLATDLNSPNPPAMVVIDELSLATAAKIKRAGEVLGSGYPGRWAVYIAGGGDFDYQVLNSNFVLNQLVLGGAHLFPELYVYYKRLPASQDPENASRFNYCDGGSNTGARDIWMSQFFMGPVPGGAVNRLNWLVNFRNDINVPHTKIVPIFAVADRWIRYNSSQVSYSGSEAFLNRLFYVFRTRVRDWSLMRDANLGGVGSYSWSHDQCLRGSGNRDNAFTAFYLHYCRAPYPTSSYSGQPQPPCS